MARAVLMVLAVLFMFGLGGCGSRNQVALASGESLGWQSLEGQWVIINYWAEWCKPCYEEIPELNELDKDPRVRVLGVNYDGITGADLNELIDRMGVRFSTLVESPAERFGWGRPVGLPATFVINPKGEVVEARFGPQTLEELLAVITGEAAG